MNALESIFKEVIELVTDDDIKLQLSKLKNRFTEYVLRRYERTELRPVIRIVTKNLIQEDMDSMIHANIATLYENDKKTKSRAFEIIANDYDDYSNFLFSELEKRYKDSKKNGPTK